MEYPWRKNSQRRKTDNTKMEGYFVAKEEFLNAALKTMKEEYGSINQFMIKGLNISMQQKEDFKQKVLE